MYWQKPNDATYYASDALVDSNGNVTYSDGTMTFSSTTFNYTPNASGHASGSFGSGANGQVEIDVPLVDVGSPAVGDQLTVTGGISSFSTNLPGPIAAQTGNTGQGMDFDPGLDTNGNPVPGNPYTIGDPATCLNQPAAGIPDVPWAPLLPAVGLVAIVTAGALRSRRASGQRSK